jgi:D-alanyl-D-alanine carboxypeptidase
VSIALLAIGCNASPPAASPPPAAPSAASFPADVGASPQAAGSAFASPPPRSANASDAAYADSAAQSAFASMDAPAFYVGIWDPQRGSFVHAYGKAVRDGADATPQDSLRIASITKTFTSTLVLELAQDGRIDLDTPASAYLAQPISGESKLPGITVRQLLGMQSGLADYLTDPNGIARDIAADPARAWTPLELAQSALRLDSAPPGTRGYTNTNFVLLGMIAEQVGGEPLDALIKERLTTPLGLTHTELPTASDTSLPAPAAHGYLNQECVDKVTSAGAPNIDLGTDTTDWNTSYFAGAGEMISTIDDLGAWAATNLGTDLLDAPTAQDRLDTHDIGGDEFAYGLGIKKFGDWYGHDGDAFGWNSIALHDPTTGVSFAAAVNMCTGFSDSFLDLLQTLYPDTSTRS